MGLSARKRPDTLRLEEVQPAGKAGAFVTQAFEGGPDTFFLAVRGGAADPGMERGAAAPGMERSDGDLGMELGDGDLLAVSGAADGEPGDLVVWWTGTPRSQALARVGEDLSLQPVTGFAAPPRPGAGGHPEMRGVVVGRLRRLAK